jgi:hypothetical protein
MVSLRGNKSEMESNNKCDEVPRGGHSGNPKKSGRVFRVLRNSGSENHNPRNARKNNNPKFGYPRFSGSGSGNPELPTPRGPRMLCYRGGDCEAAYERSEIGIGCRNNGYELRSKVDSLIVYLSKTLVWTSTNTLGPPHMSEMHLHFSRMKKMFATENKRQWHLLSAGTFLPKTKDNNIFFRAVFFSQDKSSILL